MHATRVAALYEGVGSLLSLFANGEDGFLFGGPFDTLERLFLTSTGATGNIAANDDPVGLNLDRRSWGGASRDAIIAVQPELLVPGSWSMSVAGGTSTAVEDPAGTLTLFCDGTNAARGDQSFTTVVGRTYRVQATAATSAPSVLVGTSQGGSQNLSATGITAGTTGSVYFVATATTTWVRFQRTASGAPVVSAISCKLVTGNHALQATSTKRPLWKANSNKPYLNFDGTDDYLQTPYIPGAAGTAAVAFRSSAADSKAMGGGGATGDKRLRIGLGSSGQPVIVFNDVTDRDLGAADRRNTDVLIVLTWDATGWAAWLDGVLASSAATAPNMNGAGTVFSFGSLDGGTAQFNNGPVYACLARSKRSTPSEIAIITREFQRTYQ